MPKRIVRREFLKKGAAVAGSAGLLSISSPRGLRAATNASERIQVGCIGMGRMGRTNMRKFTEQPDVDVVAVCDVYEPNLDLSRENSDAERYSDFRRVLDRQDIDAVIISSPDHWHPLMTVMACQAGKDVYVEKPISVAVAEGRKMVQAARRYDRIVQVGTQQRSGTHFRKAVELVQSGELGRITSVRAWNFGNSTPAGIGNPSDSEPPAGLDWDMWLGPAPSVPFNANRFGVSPDRWSSFRWFWDYAGGMMTDWGVHLLDIVQWAMKVDGPNAVSASGGKFVLEDNRDTPDTLTVTYEYPGFICTYENRVCNARPIDGHGYGIEFYGTEGTMFVDRGGFDISPEQFRQGERRIPRMYEMKLRNANDHNADHVRNFLDCVKSRSLPISDIEVGHRSTTACHLGNIAYRSGEKIGWDPQTEGLTGSPSAANLLVRSYRAPWKLEA